jgi:hypothetical protein
MNKIKRFLTKPWFRVYSRFKGRDAVQTEEQTVNRLLGFYLSSIILALLGAAIVAWIIPSLTTDQEGLKAVLELLIAAVAVKVGYDFVRDVIASEVGAALNKVKDEEGERLLQDLQTIQEQIDNSRIKQNLDNKYLSFLKQTLGSESLRLQSVSTELMKEYSVNRSEFERKLEADYRKERNFREARCVIHELPKEFLQQLAVKGISKGLGLPLREAIERTEPGRDLESLRIDLYAYLSAWLVCSLDNDNNMLMPLEPIGMSYEDKDSPNKEIYKKIIDAIGQVIINGDYQDFRYYPSSDPLYSVEVRKIIVDRLNRIFELIDQYSCSQRTQS